jgi:ectoine hydroxylase-related dioxygenase (phytanoyl-CoA dioxygenase family)
MAGFADASASRGVLILRDQLSPAELTVLRSECQSLRPRCADLHSEHCVLEVLPMESVTESSSVRTDAEAYWAARCAQTRSTLPELKQLLSIKLPAIAASALAPERSTFLFNEHYVVKPARIGGPFRWHTDAAHQLEALYALGQPPDALPAYVSLWCPLDDIDATNGSLLLLPRDAPQPPGAPWHEPADAACEAWLDGPGAAHLVRADLRAGDVVAFGADVWHASEPNRSAAERRVYYAQYSVAPICSGGSPLAVAVPCG